MEQTIISAAYLDPNRGSMQKPIGGLSVLAVFRNQKHAENAKRTYLDPNSQSMQKTRRGVYLAEAHSLYKREG